MGIHNVFLKTAYMSCYTMFTLIAPVIHLKSKVYPPTLLILQSNKKQIVSYKELIIRHL